MKLLAHIAMTVLRIQRLLSAQLILHSSAMTARIVDGIELGVFMDLVWSFELPLIMLAFDILLSIALLGRLFLLLLWCHVWFLV